MTVLTDAVAPARPAASDRARRWADATGRCLAALLLALLLPVLLAVYGLVRLTSPGPGIYRQVRVGHRGRLFVMYKFRTMRDGAEALQAELSGLNEHVGGPLFKVRQDPRLTRAGALLRRWSIDELPQLWNVVRGDMALVGPRPPLPREVAAYTPRERRRLLVKPGLTGLWQVSGRCELTWAESIRLDLQYVESWCPRLDAAILLRTLTAVVSRRGAY